MNYKYLAIRKDTGEIVEGNLLQSESEFFICGPVVDWDIDYIAPEWWALVDPQTIMKI